MKKMQINKLKYYLLILFLCSNSLVTAQVKRSKIKSLPFIEVGGPGFAISINYQQKISLDTNLNLFSARAGLGLIGPIPGIDGASLLVTMPLGFQYRPRYKRWEYGAGATLFYFTNTGFTGPGYFISLGWYASPEVRIMISPFFTKRSTIKEYFGFNSPVLPFAGVSVILE